MKRKEKIKEIGKTILFYFFVAFAVFFVIITLGLGIFLFDYETEEERQYWE